MGKIIPLLIGLSGLLLGGGLGKVFHASGISTDESSMQEHPGQTVDQTEVPDSAVEYVKMSNQFIIPVLSDGDVTAIVILSLGLEVEEGSSEEIYAREPKLRDAFLQLLFDHANAGGFTGTFTDEQNLKFLRKALGELATKICGEKVKDVLVMDLAVQAS